MEGRRPIFYHFEKFSGVVLNCNMHDKDMYALVKEIKKWNHYLLGKEIIIHIDHQPLKYLQTQSKL